VTAPPCCQDNPDPSIPFLAVDFTAPADGDCTTITVTSVAGLAEGDEITIGSGIYTLNNIISPTTIEICNNGSGITPGTVVHARNDAGQLQYPIVSITNCCDAISSTTQNSSGAFVEGTLSNFNDFANTNPATLVINNPSLSRNMSVFVTYFTYCALTTPDLAATFYISTSVVNNAQPPAPVGQAQQGYIPQTVFITPSQTVPEVYTLAPGDTLTLVATGQLINNNPGNQDVVYATFYVKATAIAVAA
jgi:hypothetical protein